MADQGTATPPKSVASPAEVLAFLISLLGRRISKDDKVTQQTELESNELWYSIPWEAESRRSSQGVTVSEDGEDPDFSSFPSLSLDRSPHEQLDEDFNKRESVEAHVASLLSRPILVSSVEGVLQQDDKHNEKLEFISERYSEVPMLMLQNFFESFSTLMNSRLRAYATFLARHGLSLFECSETDQELEERVTGVEHKLETMLEIGRLVSSHAVVTSFQAKPDDGASERQDGDVTQVSMPLTMDASIVISLPHPVKNEDEIVTVSFHVNGNITGVFSETSCLRAVQVDLSMVELLPNMIEQASRVISRIVDMTNAAYSLALPDFEAAEAEATRIKLPASPALRESGESVKGGAKKEEDGLHIVSPNLIPADTAKPAAIPDFHLSEGNTLSAEKCEHLVDYVFGKIDDSVIPHPSPKKAKFTLSEGTMITTAP